STGPDRYRRGMYIHFQRTSPYPQLMNFDAPSAELSCTRRERTDTPLQALNLMNDAVFFEAAQGLALRVMREGGETVGDRLDYVYLVTRPRARHAGARPHGAVFCSGQKRPGAGLGSGDGPVSEPHRRRTAV